MASKTQKTELIRARKHRGNKVNIKAEQKRVNATLEVLRKVTDEK